MSIKDLEAKGLKNERTEERKNKFFSSLVLWFFSSLVLWFFATDSFSQQVEAPNPPQAPDQGQQDAKISLDLKGMEIADVLKMLALRSGRNIVAGKNVRGKVTVYLKDVDVVDALEIILVSNELAYDMKGDIINVMTDREYEAIYGERFQDTKKVKIVRLKYARASEVSKALNQIKSRVGKLVVDEISNTMVIMDAPQIIKQMEELIKVMDAPTKTKIFALNYSKAETMKTKLEPLLTKGIGTLQVDERTNKIIVTDIESNIKAIETAVAEFDEKTKQVLIDSKILQITLNDEYKAGINWDAIFTGIKAQLGMDFNVITASLIPSSSTSTTAGGAVHIGGLDTKYNAEAMIKFLQKYGKTNLLASPRIVTVNNEEAKILVGTNQPYATSQTTTPATGAATTSYQITFLDLGTKLYVTPTINRAGFITMKIKPEVSSQGTPYTYGANADKVPVVNTSQAETTVMVKDGATLVIAGLIENREEEIVNQVPGLGDIPLVGSVFKNRTRGSDDNPEKKELVIFLTPHIITGDLTAPEVEKYSGLTDKLESQLTQKEISPVRDTSDLDNSAKVSNGVKDMARKMEFELSESAAPEPPKEDISIDEYYNNVRELIMDKVKENYPAQFIRGEAQLLFRIAKDGSLSGAPVLMKPADNALKEAAIKSVQAAAPFPSLPPRIKKKEEIFKIVIIYE